MRGVMAPGATGDKFNVDGIEMIGKTGTGEIYNEKTGGYDKTNYTSSAMLAAPANDPKIMVYWGMQSSNYLDYSPSPAQTIMQAALIANAVSGANPQPSNQSEEPTWSTYTMPSLINHSIEYVNSQMEGKNVNIVMIGDGNTIVDQFAKEGSTVYSYDRVFLKTNGENITMPDMTNWTRKDITAFGN